ncbi:MAG: ABC transporter ATP-binding protein/permease [Firmicutes bacterium]|nr:ABC transporter ATP-binding protein/permease [Bacillota bacterium]
MKKYIFQNAKEVLLVNLLAGASAGFAALLPYITAELVEQAGAFSGRIALRFALYYIGAVAGILVFEYLGKLADAMLRRKMMCRLKCDVAGRFLSMSQAAFHEQDSAYYMSVLTEDIPTLYQDYFMCVFDFLNSIVRVAVYLIFMFLLNPILAAVILAVCLATVAIPNVGGKRLAALRNTQVKENAHYIGRIKELFEGFILVNPITRKAFAAQHDKACEGREEAAWRYNSFSSFVEVFAGMSLYIINIAAFVCGLILIRCDLLTLGSFVGLIAFVDLLALPVQDIMYQIIGIRSAGEIREKIRDILALPDSPEKTKNRLEDNIVVRNLSFQREEFELKDIDLTLKKGRKYAVTGKSGAGKSTLLKLMLGYYEGYEGTIAYDGVAQDQCELAEMIAEINQDAVIFDAGARDNITLFGSYQSDKFDAYVEAVQAETLMRESFGEAGANISGGEKNKIALLRALNRECEVLFCDEMFSALDRGSREKISEYLSGRKDLTILSVTHDISREALAFYDEVIVMDSGRIVRQGETTEMLDFVEEFLA